MTAPNIFTAGLIFLIMGITAVIVLAVMLIFTTLIFKVVEKILDIIEGE